MLNRGYLARLAEHAEEAGDADAVLEFAPAAGDTASRLGAHREAAFQYARALRFAGRLNVRDRAALLEKRAMECGLIDQRDEAILARQDSIRLWQEAGEPVRAGDGWRRASLRVPQRRASAPTPSGPPTGLSRSSSRSVPALNWRGLTPSSAALRCCAQDTAAFTRAEKALRPG